PDSFTEEGIFPRFTWGDVFVDMYGVVYEDEETKIRKGNVNWDEAYAFVPKDDRLKVAILLVVDDGF
ncbi:MAG: hypothetical protein CUN57_02835, partial [Phototrophicales bacterium]